MIILHLSSICLQSVCYPLPIFSILYLSFLGFRLRYFSFFLHIIQPLQISRLNHCNSDYLRPTNFSWWYAVTGCAFNIFYFFLKILKDIRFWVQWFFELAFRGSLSVSVCVRKRAGRSPAIQKNHNILREKQHLMNSL